MPPVPIYTSSPMSATKASGVTPQTDSVNGEGGRSRSASNAGLPGGYGGHVGVAQLGPVPLIASPTGPRAVQAQLRYTPASPVPIHKLNSVGPPPPQPGAAPVLPSRTSVLPPPPQAGETYKPSEPSTAPQPTALPAPPQMQMQMQMPPSAVPYDEQRGTATANSFVFCGPQQIGGSGDSLSHPPGYQQDAHAADLNRDQRIAHEHSSSLNASSSGGDKAVWASAIKWAQAAGEKLSAAETEVWRRINKD